MGIPYFYVGEKIPIPSTWTHMENGVLPCVHVVARRFYIELRSPSTWTQGQIS